MDKATENYIYDAILRNYPDRRVGEEGHGHNMEDVKGVVWVVDQLTERSICSPARRLCDINRYLS